MIRYLFLFAILPSLALAQDPTPVDDLVAIVAPKEVTGTGKRSDPFVFDSSTKCVLRLTGKVDGIAWNLDDAPPSAEPLGSALVFSLKDTGEFHVMAHGNNSLPHAWIIIKSGADPPKPEDSITRRVKAALMGNPVDAGKFGAVCNELARVMDAGKFARLSEMHAAMKAGLDAVAWVPGKYPDLSTLTGELFGAGVEDRALSAEEKVIFARELRAMSAACVVAK